MCFEAQLSFDLNLLAPAMAARLRRLLASFKLPLRCQASLPWSDIGHAMSCDKKNKQGQIVSFCLNLW